MSKVDLPKLIECRPYEARITAKACGLRHLKATEKKDSHGQSPYGYEKCLNCTDARSVDKKDVCSHSGCIDPVYNNGKCRRHNGWVPKNGFTPKKQKGEVKSMADIDTAQEAEVKAEDDPICKDCGRAASVFTTAFNKKHGKHASCIERARQKVKRAEKKRATETGEAAMESIKKKVAAKRAAKQTVPGFTPAAKQSIRKAVKAPPTILEEVAKEMNKSLGPKTEIDLTIERITEPTRVLELPEVRLPLPEACASVSLALEMLTAPERGRVLQAVRLLLDVEDAV